MTDGGPSRRILLLIRPATTSPFRAFSGLKAGRSPSPSDFGGGEDAMSTDRSSTTACRLPSSSVCAFGLLGRPPDDRPPSMTLQLILDPTGKFDATSFRMSASSDSSRAGTKPDTPGRTWTQRPWCVAGFDTDVTMAETSVPGVRCDEGDARSSSRLVSSTYDTPSLSSTLTILAPVMMSPTFQPQNGWDLVILCPSLSCLSFFESFVLAKAPAIVTWTRARTLYCELRTWTLARAKLTSTTFTSSTTSPTRGCRFFFSCFSCRLASFDFFASLFFATSPSVTLLRSILGGDEVMSSAVTLQRSVSYKFSFSPFLSLGMRPDSPSRNRTKVPYLGSTLVTYPRTYSPMKRLERGDGQAMVRSPVDDADSTALETVSTRAGLSVTTGSRSDPTGTERIRPSASIRFPTVRMSAAIPSSSSGPPRSASYASLSWSNGSLNSTASLPRDPTRNLDLTATTA
mmetsp:Transcript_3373/g.7458  ORF Transcript_3373/g.7458 Transcript_3373/m.7458 type:complete len:458 (+) Transcript_3373:499-1872(+)